MPDEIARIVDEVLSRLGRAPEVVLRADAGSVAARGSVRTVLVLTEDLGRVDAVLGAASRRQRQAVSVFVGGRPKHRACAVGFGEILFSDDARHARMDLVSQFDLFFLLGLAPPTIARLAQLVVSEPLELIVFQALSRAKTVLMEPPTEDPSFDGLPSRMKREFLRLAARLVDLGVREEQVGNIFELGLSGIENAGESGGFRNDSQEPGCLPARGRPSADSGPPVILTVADIRERIGPGSRVVVAGRYRLTDLATEYVEKNGITIEER